METRERLRLILKNANISLKQLSDGADLPYSTISSLLSNGVENSKVSTVVRICDYLNISVDYLLDRAITETEDFTQEELADILNYQEFIKFKRRQTEWEELGDRVMALYLETARHGVGKYYSEAIEKALAVAREKK